jgi:hypothetical protein
VFKALLVGRSPDRFPVVSLRIFPEASDKSMCPGSTQPFEMSNWGKDDRCVGLKILPP